MPGQAQFVREPPARQMLVKQARTTRKCRVVRACLAKVWLGLSEGRDAVAERCFGVAGVRLQPNRALRVPVLKVRVVVDEGGAAHVVMKPTNERTCYRSVVIEGYRQARLFDARVECRLAQWGLLASAAWILRSILDGGVNRFAGGPLEIVQDLECQRHQHPE